MSKAHKNTVKSVSTAEIDWRNNTPVSRHYDDIYFSQEDGIAETEYVFLQQNNLPEAWQGKDRFSILETGFGTGLNFFCTLHSWFKTAAEGSVLNYISVEKYPLSKQDFEQQRQSWPQFDDYIQQLVKLYPAMISGFHSLSLFDGRVKLLLLLGDATEQLSTLMAKVDVCYLDGFAPSKNQSMWTAALFKQLARLMKPGATLSTFTAVGDVRRGLQQAGFDMKKVEAYGSKRHMLTGQLKQASPATDNLLAPWFQYPEADITNKQALVIGAGIAGLTSAIALLQNGWHVTVIEQSQRVAAAASGNPAGVIMPRLDKQQSDDARFYWQAFFTALRYIALFESESLAMGWQPSGVLQLNKKDESISQNSWPKELFTQVSREDAKQLAGIGVSRAAIWLKQAGFISPATLCNSLFEKYQQQIKFVFDTSVEKLTETRSGWQLETSRGSYHSETIVICNAEAANQFEQTKQLKIQAVRGQISYLQNTGLATTIKSVICDKGYAIPVENQQLVIGATFSRDETDTALRDDDHVYNLNQFNQSLAQNDQLAANNTPATGRASVRAMTPDRLPMVGAVPDYSSYQQHYSDLAKGRRPGSYQRAAYHRGLFINTAHGSRGLTSCFLSAEILTALMSGGAIPVDASILPRLHPARFLIKELMKKSS